MSADILDFNAAKKRREEIWPARPRHDAAYQAWLNHITRQAAERILMRMCALTPNKPDGAA